jgi:WD40 repeat protein
MMNGNDTSTSWRIEQAGNEKMELIDEGAIGHENLQTFMIYRLVPPSGESLERQDKVSLEGTLICACGYEIALKTTIGFKGMFDALSKYPDTCPRCHRSMMLTGETTGKGATEKQWLLLTPTSGKAGVVEMHGTPSGLPEIQIEKIERFVDKSKGFEKREATLNVKTNQEEETRSTTEKTKTSTKVETTSSLDHTELMDKPISLKGHDEFILSIAISPNSSFIVSGSSDGKLKIWDANTGIERVTLSGHTKGILDCAISADSTFVVSASGYLNKVEESTLKIWDTATGEERMTLEGHAGAVSRCAISSDSSFIVSSSGDKTLKIWDVATGDVRSTLEGHSDKVTGCLISPDGSYIVSWSLDRTIRLWDIETSKSRVPFWKAKKNKQQTTLSGHTDSILGCAISPDASFIVSASRDKTLKIWDAVDGEKRATLKGHTNAVSACAISSDASFIVSASFDNTLKIWDAVTGEEKATLAGHTDDVRGCAISPDSSFVVSASKDKTLRIWDMGSSKEQATLVGHTDGVNKVAISPDSKFILSASWDKTLLIWDVDNELNKNQEEKQIRPTKTIEQPPVKEKPKTSNIDKLPSEIIQELFDRRRLDPAGKVILAAILLCERTPAPFVWTGPGPDPYAVGSEDETTRHFRFLLSKIIPGYQPEKIPGHLMITAETRIAGREFEPGESLDVGVINPMLAVMLADLLEDHGVLDDLDLSKCSALSLSGNSPATGEARLALVVR